MKTVKILFWLFLSMLVVGDALILYVLASATLPASFPDVDSRIVNLGLIVVLLGLVVWAIMGGWSWLLGRGVFFGSGHGTPFTNFITVTFVIAVHIILLAAIFDWI